MTLCAMVLEREPLRLADLPGMLTAWVQVDGGFAAFGLALWLLVLLAFRFTRRGADEWRAALHPISFWRRVGIAVTILLLLAAPLLSSTWWTLAALCAIGVAVGPLVPDLFRMRARRIWGLSVLSIKEGIHRGALATALPLLAILLVLPWFVPQKPETQLSTSIQVVYWAMTPLVLVTGALLAAFSIPADVRSQTIATIVTKPVERFEIFLGRFLGYLLLMTGLLAAMSAASLLALYLHGIAGATTEGPRARVPLYGSLQFQGLADNAQGMTSGREWEYRRYIAGDPRSTHRAVWFFTELPQRLDERNSVPCEFRFDIFRLRKAEKEGQGVFCTFTFVTHRWDTSRQSEYQEGLKAARAKLADPDAYNAALDRLAEEFGMYEVPFKEITDAHSYALDVPAGLFRNAGQSTPAPQSDGKPGPLLGVSVKCESTSQLVGMAKYDLYFVDGEGDFRLNFLKGAVGLWYRLCLVIGVAVACSTYLSGVVSLVTTLFLCLAGYSLDYIKLVAAGKNEEGGPFKAFKSIMGQPLSIQPDPVADVFDESYRWVLSRFLHVLPDMNLFSLTDHVAQGFDISFTDLGLRLLVLAGYLLPWAVVAYYMLKSREVSA